LGGLKKGGIIGGGVSIVLSSGASCLLDTHDPVYSLEVLCGWVKLASFEAQDVIAACFGYDFVGRAENGGLRGIFFPFGCK
jgi:hypothetical protein